MGPTSLVNVPTQHSSQDPAMSDLLETMIHTPMILLWLMNLFGTIGQVGWLDQ